MSKILKIIGFSVIAVLAVYLSVIVYFQVQVPGSDKMISNLNGNEEKVLVNYSPEKGAEGNPRVVVTFNRPPGNTSQKEFYGLKLSSLDSNDPDSLLLGVTSNHIVRIEVWNEGRMVETKEQGFSGKMTWGDAYQLSIDYIKPGDYHMNSPHSIKMNFYKGTSFFGTIAGVSLDLADYGGLTGRQKVSTFGKGMEGKGTVTPKFCDLRVWESYPVLD